MNDDLYRKIIRTFLESGARPGRTHERLKADLDSWARTHHGYVAVYVLQDGLLPDVVLTKADALFVGDAKDSKNETVSNNDTVQRIGNYIIQFAKQLAQFKGGHLAIATDDKSAAIRWVETLNALCSGAGITAGDGSAPNFQVLQLPGKTTFIVWW